MLNRRQNLQGFPSRLGLTFRRQQAGGVGRLAAPPAPHEGARGEGGAGEEWGMQPLSGLHRASDGYLGTVSRGQSG